MTAKRKPPPKSRPRREKGSGSITSYETKAGTRWRYEIDVPLDAGQPQIGTRSHSRAGFTRYEEANDELLVLRAELIRNVPQSIGRDTFGAYGQRWLDGHSCGNGTRLYIQRVIDAMHPYIGTVRLSDIRATDLAAAYRGLERGTKQKPSPKRPRLGLATSTVARYASWVNTIFLAALDEGLIIKNPANSKHAGRPRGESAKRVKPFTIWNVEQLTTFCDWALAADQPWAHGWVSGTSTPYDVPFALAALKLALGTLTAIGGLLVLRGQFVPGLSELDSQGQILAYAPILGYAQQVLTSLIDKQADHLLASAPGKDTHVDRPQRESAGRPGPVSVAKGEQQAGRPPAG